MTQSTHSRAPGWRTPVIIGVVAILAVVAGVLLASVLGANLGTGAGDPSSTPVPSADPSSQPSKTPASPEPSEDPSAPAQPSEAPDPTTAPVVQAPEGVLPPGAVARVTADGLRVREGPTTGATEVITLSRGDLVVLGYSFLYPGFGPSEADGYVWYPVAVLGATELPAPGGQPLVDTHRGWVAIGDGEDAWVEVVAPRCTDAEPTLQLLASLTEWERLACYGDGSITMEGVLGCGGCGGLYPGTFEPEWLASPMNYDLLSVEPQERIGPLRLSWSPDGPDRPSEPGVAPILRVTGHFDDPAARGCVVAPGEPEQIPLDAVVAELYCRSQFVVESYEILGTDEDFPFG